MKIVLTGAAGFIGSHLCDRFIKEGHTVFAFDNLITGSIENISHLMNKERFLFFERDVSFPFYDLDKPDYVLHFASPASPNPNSPIGYPNLPVETLKAGSYGTFNAMEIAMYFQAKFLFASTSEVYGDAQVHPQPETYWGNVNPIGARSMYDEAKRFGEATTMAYHRKYGVDTRIVRIFNTYGERMADDGRVIPNFMKQALRGEPLTVFNGKQTRTFCYVGDLVEGIYRLMNTDYHEPVNLGGNREITILELARLVNQACGNESINLDMTGEGLGDDPQRRKPDISLAKKLFDFHPSTTIRTGLMKTMIYFKNKGVQSK
jgi:dTDP-glucose 4,6-dehydratase